MMIIRTFYNHHKMERLPCELSIYISNMGNLATKLFTLNRDLRDLFEEETRRLKFKATVIDTLLVEMKSQVLGHFASI